LRGRGGQKGKEEAEGEDNVHVGKSGYRETWIRQGEGEEQIEGGIVEYHTEGRAEQAEEAETDRGRGGAGKGKEEQAEEGRHRWREWRSKQK
jgi:hypothetical protein